MRDALEEEIRAGELAAAMLEEPVLKAAFEELEAEYTDAWRNSGLVDVTRREEAFRMLRALDELRGNLQAKVVNGQIARANAEAAERARLVGGMVP